MQGNIGKIFITNKLSKAQHPLHFFEHSHMANDFLIAYYDYSQPNSYSDLINKAYELKLGHLILGPYKMVMLIRKLLESSFKIKKIEFEPKLSEDEQTYIEELIFNLLNEKNNVKKLSDFIFYNDDEYNIIPWKISFISPNSNYYSVYNNGVITTEDSQSISEIEGVFSSLIHGVQ